MSEAATNTTETGGQVHPMVMHFYPPDTVPAYANTSQYLLWVSCDSPEEGFDDDFLWGLWHEGQWWILNDDLDHPFEDDKFEQDGEINEVVSFVKFSDQDWFGLRGWAKLYGGVSNVRFPDDDDGLLVRSA